MENILETKLRDELADIQWQLNYTRDEMTVYEEIELLERQKEINELLEREYEIQGLG